MIRHTRNPGPLDAGCWIIAALWTCIVFSARTEFVAADEKPVVHMVRHADIPKGLFSLLDASPFSERSPRPQSHRIRFALQPFPSKALQPPKRLRLVNGDTLTAEVMAGDREFLQLRLFGEQRFQVPTRFVDSLTVLPGERVLVNEGFTKVKPNPTIFESDSNAEIVRDSLIISATPQLTVLQLPTNSENFRCWLRFRWIGSATGPTEASGWTWQFADDARLSLQCDASGNWQAVPQRLPSSPVTRQSILADSAWHIAQLSVHEGRLYASLDDRLLYAGPSSGSPLKAIAIQVNSSGRSPDGQCQIDHISLTESFPWQPNVPLEHPRLSDQISGIHGETWWGNWQALGPEDVTWINEQTTWRRDWTQLQGVSFHTDDGAVIPPPRHGLVARLVLQSTTDRPDLPGDSLTVVLGPAEQNSLNVEHPLCGRLLIPWDAIREVETLFSGEWRLLDAREFQPEISESRPRLQLENEKHPAGSGSFWLAELPRDSIFFSVEAAELEPAGPETPPGSPTLAALRTGRGVVELFLNGQRIGTLNELTSHWSLPGCFDRLRSRIPPSAFRSGENTWQIRQTPFRQSSRSSHRCRLRNIALETEANFP